MSIGLPQILIILLLVLVLDHLVCQQPYVLLELI